MLKSLESNKALIFCSSELGMCVCIYIYINIYQERSVLWGVPCTSQSWGSNEYSHCSKQLVLLPPLQQGPGQSVSREKDWPCLHPSGGGSQTGPPSLLLLTPLLLPAPCTRATAVSLPALPLLLLFAPKQAKPHTKHPSFSPFFPSSPQQPYKSLFNNIYLVSRISSAALHFTPWQNP